MEKQIINRLQELSFTNRHELYSNFMDKFSTNLGEIENNPFIGYMGKEYLKSKNKLCFVAKAGGESRFLTHDDKVMNDCFEVFRNSTTKERINSFWSYQGVIKNHIQNWNVFRIPAYLNSKIGQNIDYISYINIVPFRYKGAPTKTVYKIAWDNFTNNLLSILNPDLIIPLGKNLHSEILQNYLGDAEVTNGITRTNGDNYLHNEAMEQMDDIARRISKKGTVVGTKSVTVE